MKDIAVVLITVDRTPAENYLAQTLTNLRRAKTWDSVRFHSLILCDSGGSDTWPEQAIRQVGVDKVIVYRSPDKKTPNRNVADALRIGASICHNWEAKWVLFLEDDIDVCDHFIDSVGVWLDEHSRPNYHVFALGANYDRVTELAREGKTNWEYPIDGFYGTQAFAIRPDDAKSLSSWLEKNEFSKNVDGSAYDLIMHDWAHSTFPNNQFFLASVPSFVQHIGTDSVIRPRAGIHTFPSWPGQNWRYEPKTVNL